MSPIIPAIDNPEQVILKSNDSPLYFIESKGKYNNMSNSRWLNNEIFHCWKLPNKAESC